MWGCCGKGGTSQVVTWPPPRSPRVQCLEISVPAHSGHAHGAARAAQTTLWGRGPGGLSGVGGVQPAEPLGPRPRGCQSCLNHAFRGGAKPTAPLGLRPRGGAAAGPAHGPARCIVGNSRAPRIAAAPAGGSAALRAAGRSKAAGADAAGAPGEAPGLEGRGARLGPAAPVGTGGWREGRAGAEGAEGTEPRALHPGHPRAGREKGSHRALGRGTAARPLGGHPGHTATFR